jgi:polyphosphate kinase
VRMLIGSADLMPRNLDRRIEVLLPVESSRTRHELNAILDSVFADNTFAWELAPDGTWSRLTPGKGQKTHVHQAVMQRRARTRAKRARDARNRP